LLTTFYAIAFALPLLTLRSAGERLAVTAAVGFGSAALAIAAALTLRYGANQADHFDGGRLSFPISYQDGLAAAFLVGVWPAVLLAAQRTVHPLLRAASPGGAAAIVAGALATQSKGGIIALAVSALAVFALSPSRLRLLVPAFLAVGAAAAAVERLTR